MGFSLARKHYISKESLVRDKHSTLFGQFASFKEKKLTMKNGTARFKNVNNCLNTNIYSYLETSGSESFNFYSNVVHFFNASVNLTSVAA